MGSLHPLLLAGLAMAAVGTIVLIVGIATPNWSVKEDSDMNLANGLFITCDLKGEIEECGPREQRSDVNAVIAMTIMGLVCSVGADASFVASYILPLFGTYKLHGLPLAGACLAGAAFLFTIIGDIVWAAKVHQELDEQFLDQNVTLSYSFDLSIIGAIVHLAGGALGYFGAKRMVEEEDHF